MEAARAPVVAADIPSGVDATTGEVEGPAVHCVATAAFHRPKVGLWVRPGKEYAGDVEVVDIGIPRGGPARPDAGLIGSGRAARHAAAHAGVDEVLLRQRVHHRRLARADGRAVHGRAGRDARRSGLCDGRRTGESRAELHGETAGGDDGRAARGRRRAPRRVGRGAGAEGDRARGRRRARPGALEGPGRAGAGPRRDPADRRAAGDRRRRAQRAGRAPRGGAAAAALADGPDPARGRARRGCSRSIVRGCRALAPAPRARGGGALARVRGAQGRRHAGGGAVGAGGDLARASRRGWPPRARATCWRA